MCYEIFGLQSRMYNHYICLLKFQKKILHFTVLKGTNIYLCAEFQLLKIPHGKDPMADGDHHNCSYQPQEGLAYGQTRGKYFSVQMVLWN